RRHPLRQRWRLGREPDRVGRAPRWPAGDHRLGGACARGATCCPYRRCGSRYRMKLALVTDAWHPQVNGVVTTLAELVDGLAQRGHEVDVMELSAFCRFPFSRYRTFELTWWTRAVILCWL